MNKICENPDHPRRPRAKNAGFTIVELIAAMMVVSLCIMAFVKIAHIARQQREYGREHQTAVDQTLNVLEYLCGRDVRVPNVAADPVQLAAGEIDMTQYEALIARTLPDGKLLVTCEPLAVEGAAVDVWRLDATVSWKPGANLPQRNVAFTRLISRQRDEGREMREEGEETHPSPLVANPSEEGGVE